MKVLDIINQIDRDDVIIYLGKDVSEEEIEKSVLLVSHDMTLTGAPIALAQMADILKKNGYEVFVLCHKDGYLTSRFTDSGIHVIIREAYLNDKKWCKKLCATQNYVVVNTLAIYEMFVWLNAENIKVMWWLHEQEANFKLVQKYIDLKNISLNDNSSIYAAGPYVQKMIDKYMNLNAGVLNFGIKDQKKGEVIKDGYVHFINIGLINSNKGQDILVEAIDKLDKVTKEKVKVTFCGSLKIENAEIDVAKKIINLVSRNKNVRLIDEMPHEELLELMDSMDGIIVASYEETTSAVMVEGMMKEKIGICSDTCGVTKYLHNGIDSIIYPYGDSDKLAEVITYVVNNIDKLDTMRKAGRKVYEEVYSEEVFEKNILKIIND